MKHPLIVVLAALIALTLAPVIVDMAGAQETPTPPAPVPPQMGCAPASQLFAALEAIGEAPKIVGVGPRGSTGILARNTDTTSWTFVLVSPDGCLMFSIGGDHSATFEQKPGEPS